MPSCARGSTRRARAARRFARTANGCAPPRLPPAASFDEVIDEAVRFVEEFQRTRPEREIVIPEAERRQNSRMPGKGRTGREEWT